MSHPTNRYLPSRIFLVALAFGTICTACGTRKSAKTANYTVIRSEIENKNVVILPLIKQSNEEFAALERMGNEKFLKRHHDERVLYLPNLTSLTVDQAVAISEYGSSIYINGVETLTPEIAKIISMTPYDLHLNGITELDPEAAKALGTYQHNHLSLNGLTELTPAVASGLQHQQGTISLNGLVRIETEAAKALRSSSPPKNKFNIPKYTMNGITILRPETAKQLFQSDASWDFNSLTTLNEECTKVFAQSSFGTLSLRGLETLTDTQLQHFSESDISHLKLGLTSLDKNQSDILSSFTGSRLSLDSIQTIDTDTLRNLMKIKSLKELSLNGLTQLNPESASILTTFTGESLQLNNITSLEEDTAIALSEGKTKRIALERFEDKPQQTLESPWKSNILVISLNGLQEIPRKTLMALVRNKELVISLDGLRRLDAETAKIFNDQVICSLSNLQTLDKDTASVLRKKEIRVLTLSSLTSITPEVALELSKCKGDELNVKGLKELDLETKNTLLKYSGVLLLPSSLD